MQLDDLARLRRARDRMDREFASPLAMADLARDACMSVGHFQRAFKAAYGETPYQHLMTRRIERAAWLLRGGNVSVTHACMAVGCSSLGSFSASFTKIVGETPTAYAARDHSDADLLPPCVAKIVGRPIRIKEAPGDARVVGSRS